VKNVLYGQGILRRALLPSNLLGRENFRLLAFMSFSFQFFRALTAMAQSPEKTLCFSSSSFLQPER